MGVLKSLTMLPDEFFCIEQRLNAKPRIVQEDRRIWKMEELYEQQKIH